MSVREPWFSALEPHDLRVGDDVVFLGTPHRITAIEPYEGPMNKYGCFALAKARDGWSMALYDGQTLEVA